MGLRTQLRLARLQLVTDLRVRQGDWPQFVRTVFDNGVDILQVQVGAQGGGDRATLEALETARAIAFDHRRLVAVAGDPAIAVRFGADVLHLDATDAPAVGSRRGLPEASLVGRSVHSGVQLHEALAEPGVDYLFVGPVFPGAGVGRVPGTDLVREAALAAVPSDRDARPWFACGGIGTDNLQAVLDAGARRIAVGDRKSVV